jgi:3-oxoacyl-[acyl-carrier protein] reductase
MLAVDQKELTGRVALVTGVGRREGIGAAIARELASAGASVFFTFFRDYDDAQSWGSDPTMPQSLLEELGQLAEACEFDLSDIAAPADLFAAAIRRFGRVDILINNACFWEGGGIDKVDAPQLDRHYAVNTRAAVLLCAEFVRHKASGSPGCIINITSGQGQGPMPGELAYVVTKAALDALTLTLSAELAEHDITVNAVDPGPTDTGWMTSLTRAALVASSPTGAIASASDTARVVKALVVEQTSKLNGQIVRVQPVNSRSASSSEQA